MAANAPSDEIRLARVSSLYGPGAVTAWFFTILSVLVSWTLHPRKRKSGSIDVNLIAVLTLPAVAVGHVIWQGQNLSAHMAEPSVDSLIQSIAAIEAPFILTDTFMSIAVILFLVAAWTYCIRRAALVAVIGLACFAVESYVLFFSQSFQYKPGTLEENLAAFSRPFLADFTGLLMAVVVLLGLLMVFSGLITTFMLLKIKESPSYSAYDIERSIRSRGTVGAADDTRSSPPNAQSHSSAGAATVSERIDTAVEAIQPSLRRQSERVDNERKILLPLTMLSVLFLPMTAIASLMPTIWHTAWYHTATSLEMSLWNRIRDSGIRFGKDFFPRTPCSITDLDQAVAAVAGALGLVFSIYSVSKAYYKTWITTKSGSDTAASGRPPSVFELSLLQHRPRRRSL